MQIIGDTRTVGETPSVVGDNGGPLVVVAPEPSAIGVHGVGIGYNHNINYGSHVYHIQTEDSGRVRGHVFTHVFLSGTIIASNKVTYQRHDRFCDVIALAKASHKLMMRRLVRGLLDEDIARCQGQVNPSPPESCPLEDVASVDTLEVVEAPASAEASVESSQRAEQLQNLIEALDMDNVDKVLQNIKNGVSGCLGVALVDYESGMCLGTQGTGLDMDVAAAGSMAVMKAKFRVMRDLGIEGGIEDMLITLDSQYHIIRPVGSALFLYLAINRKEGNLATARHKLVSEAAEISL